MYAIIDTETTGLDPEKHAVISVRAVIKSDLREDYALARAEFKINPKGFAIDPKALEVNGYTEEEINSWPDRVEVIPRIWDFFSKFAKATPVGHNYPFDQSFLTRQVFGRDIYDKFFNYRMIDTASLALALNIARPGFSAGTSLNALREKFKVSNVGAHTALVDAESTAVIIKELLYEIRGTRYV
jgi:DNA polymerase III epsilon subunit-like protein